MLIQQDRVSCSIWSAASLLSVIIIKKIEKNIDGSFFLCIFVSSFDIFFTFQIKVWSVCNILIMKIIIML